MYSMIITPLKTTTTFSISSHDRVKKKKKGKFLVVQLCSTLCDHMDYSPPGSSVHGIFQARILEWVALPFSRGSSQPKDQSWVSHTAGRLFTV